MHKNTSCQEPGFLDSGEDIKSLADHEILDILYHTYGKYIQMVVQMKIEAAGLPEYHAGDCLSHVIMKLAEHNCKRVRQFRGQSAFKTYLTVLCRNLVIDYIRTETRKKRLTTNIDDTASRRGLSAEVLGANLAADDPALQLIRSEEEILIAKAVEIISKEVRRLEHLEQCIFRIRIEEGRSFREIDEFLGIDNSKYRFSKILDKIRSSVDSSMRKRIEELLAET
jgi:RNA polymerase sigma factor (sigma-70 family)